MRGINILKRVKITLNITVFLSFREKETEPGESNLVWKWFEILHVDVPEDGFPLEEDDEGKDAKYKNGDSGNRPGYHFFQLHTFGLKRFKSGLPWSFQGFP